MSHILAGIIHIQFDLRDEKGDLLSEGIYRCIYRFEDKMTGEFGIFHGHGDIKVE